MAFGKGARAEVQAGMDGGAFARRGRASVPGSGSQGEVKELLHGSQEGQAPRWRPPMQPVPIDVSTGPPPPPLQSKLGVVRERRQPNEELEQRRQHAVESAKAFHEARAMNQNARGKAQSNCAPFAVGDIPVGESQPSSGRVSPGVLRERNRSRPASRELEAVKADKEKAALLREIEEAAAEARRSVDDGTAFWAARAVAEQGRSRNRGAGLFDGPEASVARGHHASPTSDREQCATLYPDDAAGSFHAAKAARELALERNRGGEAARVFGDAAQPPMPPARDARPNIINWS